MLKIENKRVCVCGEIFTLNTPNAQRCKTCEIVKGKADRAKHKERDKLRRKQYYEANKEKLKTKRKEKNGTTKEKMQTMQ